MTVLFVVAAVSATIVAIAAWWLPRAKVRRGTIPDSVPVASGAPACEPARAITAPPAVPSSMFPPNPLAAESGPEDTWTGDSDSTGDYGPTAYLKQDDEH